MMISATVSAEILALRFRETVKNLLIFILNQPALSVFRYLSPDVFIGMISGYLISLYNSNSFEKFADIGELLEKSVNN